MAPSANIFRGRATGGRDSLADAGAVRQALAILADPAANVELRGLPSARSRVRPGNDLDALVSAAQQLAGDAGVYYTLNPVDPHQLPAGADRAARVADIARRRWLLVDVDPVRPKDSNATEAEKSEARVVSDSVREWLSGRGWPAPVQIDSGNGFHLLYRIDLPCDPPSQDLLKFVLGNLAAAHDSEGACIDRAVHNASRISKLPGTWARKGPKSDERPHRPALLLSVPDRVEVVTLDQLRDVASLVIPEPQAETVEIPPEKSPFKGKATSDDRQTRYAQAALAQEVNRVHSAPVGERNNALNRAAFSLGQLVAAGHLPQLEVEQALAAAAASVGLDEVETIRTIRSGLTKGMEQPRQGVPEKEPAGGHGASKQASKKQAHQQGPEVPVDGPVIVRASEVSPRRLEWLWPGRLPAGKLVTFAGPGGTGKTFALLDISARITRGADWPDRQPGGDPRSVLFISSEDDPADTLVPRLIEVEADLDRVGFLRAEVNAMWCLQRMDLLRAAVDQLGNVGMVVIDPPTSYLGGVDDHKNGELRQLLHPLSQFAAEVNAVVILNTHVNKGTSSDLSAAGRIMGSVAWVNAVRAAYLLVKDPDDHTGERRLFAQVKCNLAKEPSTLAYKIVPAGDMARVEWLGAVETTADQAVGSPAIRRKNRVREWLLDCFRRKRRWLSVDLYAEGAKAGYSEDAIKRTATKEFSPPPARQRITVEDGQGGSSQCWIYVVPNNWAPLGGDEEELI